MQYIDHFDNTQYLYLSGATISRRAITTKKVNTRLDVKKYSNDLKNSIRIYTLERYNL